MTEKDLVCLISAFGGWRYKDVELKILPALQKGDEESYWIKFSEGEEINHIILKVAVIAHLLDAGFKNKDILSEYNVSLNNKNYRADYML